MHEFDADLQREEVAVTFKGKKTEYYVTELSSFERDKVAQRRFDAAERDPDTGKPKESIIDQQAETIVASLKRKDDAQPPDLDDVRMWGTRTCMALGKIIDRLNGLSEEGQDAIKKDSEEKPKSGTT